MHKLRKIIRNNHYSMVLFGVLILLIVFMSIISPHFFTTKNLLNILNQSSTYLIMSLGAMLVIASGQTDLSTGSIVGMSGLLVALLSKFGFSELLSIIIGLLIVTLIGAINGIIVSYGKIHSFIVTLATQTILRGIILVVTQAQSVFGFGDLIKFIGSGKVGPISFPIILSVIIALISSVIMNHTKFGTYTHFIGTNEVALHRSGVNVKKYKVSIFMLSAFLSGISGLIILGRLNSAEPLAGQGYELEAITIAVLGGTNSNTGKASAFGVFIASLILIIIENGLVMVGLSTHYQRIITGVILILSVLFSESHRRKQNEV